MAKADMHVHSKFSKHPSEWFLQRLGAAESYTEPDSVVEKARLKGMEYFTLTDHNTIDGALYLKEKYPDKAFVSVEATAYFPEDGCKVHILVYDITTEEFLMIDSLREDIYKLRDYIKSRGLAHSVAHATYGVNNRLSSDSLEKLILLFDIFEGQNGARSSFHNQEWTRFLKSLTPEDITAMKERHGIEPYSDTAWIKGFTGGSDDHAGLYVGATYTVIEAETLPQFLDKLKKKSSFAEGRHNDFKALAFAIYKIAYDFSIRKSKSVSGSLISQINALIFENKDLNLKGKFILNQMKGKRAKNFENIRHLLTELIETLKREDSHDMDVKLNFVYDQVSKIMDEFISLLVRSIKKDLKNGDLLSLIKSISFSLPGLFLSVPFISTFKHLFQNRELLEELEKKNGRSMEKKNKKVLWFTDTISDLNGVSVTIRKIGWMAYKHSKNLLIATSLGENDNRDGLPPNMMNFSTLFDFEMPFYSKISIKIPSIMEALKRIYEYNPDEIIISTPGPIGLLGLFAAKLLNVRVSGIYHTDFTLQACEIVKDESVINLVENGVRWFYSSLDHIRVPSREYINILEERGYNRDKMSVFRRAIDMEVFRPRFEASKIYKKEYGLKNGPVLLYTGRISEDKSLDFLVETWLHLRQEIKGLNLVLVGDGPHLKAMRKKYQDHKGIVFTGLIPNEKLPEFYSAADIFVFPSTTDTFGMSVLEAQACGLPAVVSNIGGPKEIVEDGVTGLVALADSSVDWQVKIAQLVSMLRDNPGAYSEMKRAAFMRIYRNYQWNNIFKDLFETDADSWQLKMDRKGKDIKPNTDKLIRKAG